MCALVVAVFIQASKENVALARAFQSLPAKEGDTVARLTKLEHLRHNNRPIQISVAASC